MALQPGARLGSFEVLGPLGAGGMGEVYRALDTNLGREVAIKVLPAAFAADPARTARFDREGRLLATINHPAIAAIYGAEHFDGLPCIIMELVPGETLSEILARGPIPMEEALDISRQLAEALEAAHERGVIHRDLKPANIKITPQGKVKVLDLGLAKATEQPSSEDLSRSPTLPLDETRPGVVLGTIEFMSPEQARGKDVDKRTDIWAFGCVVYEMLSGRRAFTGDNAADVFAAILSSEPDWSALPPSTPPRLRELLSRCLQKDPRQRLRDIGDVRGEIELIRGGPAPPAPAPIAPRSESRWPAASIVVVIAAAAAAAWFALRSSPLPAPAGVAGRKQLAVLPFRDLTGDEKGVLMGVGLVETVSARLSGLPGLQVVTPNAVVAAADQNGEVLRVARRVGANVVVLGTFQRQGDKVRITYRVVNVQDGVQVSAGKLDGSASDLFALQDTLAEVVAKDLHLGPARVPTVPSGLDAAQQAQYLEAVGLLQRYDRRDSVERGVAILSSLAADRPNSAPVQAALGRASLAMFDFTKDRAWADRAIAAADAARATDPSLPQVDVTVGETLLTTGRSKEAVAAFRRALQSRPDDFQALLGLGRASQRAGDDASAEAAFRRAISLQPSAFAAYNQLGSLYASQGRWNESAELFRKAVLLAPDSYRALSNLGVASTMRCDYSAALDAFRKALALKPDDPVAASNLGVTQLWTGRSSEAVASLELASRQSPRNFRILANLGDAYRAAGGRDAKALVSWERSIGLAREQLGLDPRDALAHSCIAAGLAKTNHPAEAAGEMKEALALDSRDASILLDAAVVAALANRKAEAFGWMRKAVEQGNCREVIARQPEFQKFRGEAEFEAIVAGTARAAAF